MQDLQDSNAELQPFLKDEESCDLLQRQAQTLQQWNNLENEIAVCAEQLDGALCQKLDFFAQIDSFTERLDSTKEPIEKLKEFSPDDLNSIGEALKVSHLMQLFKFRQFGFYVALFICRQRPKHFSCTTTVLAVSVFVHNIDCHVWPKRKL